MKLQRTQNLSQRTSGFTQSTRGFTLVELMIAILIGLFLTAGLLTLVQAMKRTTTSQSGLSQLQDNQRLAMSLIANAVQSSGYFPSPLVNTAATIFPLTTVAPIFAAGQSMTGGHTSATVPDTIVMRYSTLGGDNVMNCAGTTSAAPTTWTATLNIDVANQNLQCVLFNSATNITTTVQLVNGVTNMQI
ncbi:MAG: prepilin-type N-terminal cleavage/methylation domain-containing protein, partial [Gammaproteobacteria bacterium]